MSGDSTPGKSDDYWDRAGALGYARSMFPSSDAEAHVRGRQWQAALDIAEELGVPADGHVLDLGCGDGAFANQRLAARYRKVDGIDKSDAAINRANAESQNHASFHAVDLVTFDYSSLPHYDAAFLIGILHHVKQATSHIVRAMAQRTGTMIVLEPNGSNLIRKAMEFTPSYRAAGEDSFRNKDLKAIFAAAGWRTEIWRRVSIFPNFTPAFVCHALAPIEPWIEQSRFWNALCTVDMYGLTLAP